MDKVVKYPYKAFELVMLQPTSFCNIQCEYCYLNVENRSHKNTMSFDTLEKVCQRIFSSTLIKNSQEITFMWHEGEPLVMPISYYEQAFSIINKYAKTEPHTIAQHSILTNGTLITKDWCSFFQQNDVKVGISIDGPDFIHDAKRKTRSGKGTFNEVKRGLEILRENNIDPYFLTTVHEVTLDHPKELFEFYITENVKKIGLNFEEILGNNKISSLQKDSNLIKVKKFIKEFYSLYKSYGKLFVREFDNLKFIISDEIDLNQAHLDTISPYSILTVNYKGDFSTFAPELIDMNNYNYGDFIFGNVYSSSIEESMNSEKFKTVLNDIKEGIYLCQKSCEYFQVCGSNLPAHKITENGSFSSSETLYCKVAIQAIADELVDDILSEI